MIIGDRIREAGIVSPEPSENLKNSTCDLTVGEIIPTGDQSRKVERRARRSFLLKPSHMVFVVTLQKLTLPRNVTGVATLVTSMTKEGILCLNTGIVDPGYSGHLGATLVNFSTQPRKIYLDQRLFRVIFLEHEDVPDKYFKPYQVSKRDYTFDQVEKAKDEFAETFLDVQGIHRLAKDRAWSIVTQSMLSNWLPWLALLVSVLSLAY